VTSATVAYRPARAIQTGRGFFGIGVCAKPLESYPHPPRAIYILGPAEWRAF
jgi:hypothetical protein